MQKDWRHQIAAQIKHVLRKASMLLCFVFFFLLDKKLLPPADSSLKLGNSICSKILVRFVKNCNPLTPFSCVPCIVGC